MNNFLLTDEAVKQVCNMILHGWHWLAVAPNGQVQLKRAGYIMTVMPSGESVPGGWRA